MTRALVALTGAVLALSACTDPGAEAGRASGPNPAASRPAVEYPGGQALLDGFVTVPGTELAAPVGRVAQGSAAAWYATVVLDPDTTAADAVRAFAAQADRAGYTRAEAGSTKAGESGAGSPAVRYAGRTRGGPTRTLDIAGADASGQLPGYVRLIMTSTSRGG